VPPCPPRGKKLHIPLTPFNVSSRKNARPNSLSRVHGNTRHTKSTALEKIQPNIDSLGPGQDGTRVKYLRDLSSRTSTSLEFLPQVSRKSEQKRYQASSIYIFSYFGGLAPCHKVNDLPIPSGWLTRGCVTREALPKYTPLSLFRLILV
jgi:hypothetical protein